MKIYFVLCVFGVALMVNHSCLVAADMHEHPIIDRSLQNATPQDQKDTCDNVCEDLDPMSSINVQVVKVESNNHGLFSSFFRSFSNFFGDGSRSGGVRNGYIDRFRRHRNNKPKYEVNTDVLISALTTYSMKAKSLATLLREESATYEELSETPDVVKAIFDLSAENMESVTSVVDPIIDEMRQYEKLDLLSVSCAFRDILAHLQVNTFPFIVSLAEFIYTKSGSDNMEEMFMNYVATRPMDTSEQQTRLFDREARQCLQDQLGNTSPTEDTSVTANSFASKQATPLGPVGTYLIVVGTSLSFIVVLVILFPISVIISFAALLFLTFSIILFLVTDRPLIPPNDNPCEIACGVEGLVLFLGNLALIASPLLIPIGIVVAIGYFVVALLSPLFGITNQLPPFGDDQNPAFAMSNDVMQKLSLVLNSPLGQFTDALKNMNGNEESEEINQSMNCQMKAISCENSALMASLPF